MNRQEIVQTLDSPSIPDFPALYAMCQDPELLEDILSLAITKGEQRGRMDTLGNYNKALHEREDRYREPKEAGMGIKNVVGYVML